MAEIPSQTPEVVPSLTERLRDLRGTNEAQGQTQPRLTLRTDDTDWRNAAMLRDAEEREQRLLAALNSVRVTKGPIVAAILIAQLITAVVGAIVYAIVIHLL